MRARVESEQHAHVTAAGAKLLHVGMPRAFDGVHQRSSQRWAALLEQTDRGSDALLLVLAEVMPPRTKGVGVLDFPHPNGINRSL